MNYKKEAISEPNVQSQTNEFTGVNWNKPIQRCYIYVYEQVKKVSRDSNAVTLLVK